MEERLNALLRLALRHHASDIHFTRRYNDFLIEMRIGDKIYPVKSKVGDLKLLRYLEYLANLDIGNLLKPQTGQFEWVVEDHNLSLRFALIHELHIENGVLRIMDEHLKLDEDHLSIDNEQNRFFAKMLRQKMGLFICAGPTGSGKTTTLYTLLKKAKTKKIFTIEDPVEVHYDDLMQISVSEGTGIGLDEAIKQVLRHDPDIIMIGEVRDEKTAKMAIRAANTGHLVLTSLHAGTSLLAIERLLELGVEKGQLRNVLLGIATQRLVKLRNSTKKMVVYETVEREVLLRYLNGEDIKGKYSDLKDNLDYAAKKGLIENERENLLF